jgi:hypothetical protein
MAESVKCEAELRRSRNMEVAQIVPGSTYRILLTLQNVGSVVSFKPL